LREVAQNLGVKAHLIDAAAEIDPAWISATLRVGVTAGASAPEDLVHAVIQRLRDLGAGAVRTLDGVAEKVSFPLPKALVDA
jgi:4-hydroxy-3-methylbut-2-enyl diphosphate reductase